MANDVFVQSLIPEEHSVLVKKNNYYDYSKTIAVEQKEVTKLENILLFKKDILFSLTDGIQVSSNKIQSPFISRDKYIIKNNNLYFSSITQNATLTAAQKTTPVLKKMVAFSMQGNNIIWLATDGFIYKSDVSGTVTTTAKITKLPIKTVKSGTYKIINDDKNIFLNNNGNLLLLNSKTNKKYFFDYDKNFKEHKKEICEFYKIDLKQNLNDEQIKEKILEQINLSFLK